MKGIDLEKNKFKMNFVAWRITLLIVGGIFFLLNILTPYIADDYSFMLTHDFVDILHRGYNLYLKWTGRVPAHLLTMFALAMGKGIFNVLNTLIYLLFIVLCCFHASFGLKTTRGKNTVCILLINILLFLYVESWGQVFLWVTGVCNYLWTCTIILLFLVPYRKYWEVSSDQDSKWILLFVLVFGFLAGCSNENTSGGAVLFCIIVIGMLRLQKRKVPLWMYMGLLSVSLGFIFMICAPGNRVRKTYFIDGRAWYNRIIDHFQTITQNYYHAYKYLLFLAVIGISLLIWLLINKKISRDQCIKPFVYLFISLAVCYALVLSPATGGRAMFGSSVFLIIAVTYEIMLCLDRIPQISIVVGCYLSVILLVFIVNFCAAFIDITYYKVHSDRRDQFVLDQREMGGQNLIVNQIAPTPRTKYNGAYGLRDLMNDPEEWPNDSYASYYGLETITAVSNDMFEKVFKNGSFQLINCRDIYEYLQVIDNPDYLVLMAVNDDSSGAVDDRIVELMKKLGLKTDLRENFRWSYLAVINQGKVVDEKYGNEVLNYFDTVNGHSVEIESSGKIYNKGNRASIKIDGYEYARNSIGLNIVVFDNVKGQVVDRVTFNTWKGLEASR